MAVGVPLANQTIDRGAARDKLRVLAQTGAIPAASRLRAS
jgi:hypothetical protein